MTGAHPMTTPVGADPWRRAATEDDRALKITRAGWMPPSAPQTRPRSR